MTDMAPRRIAGATADETAFRELMCAFPSGVTVVTTRDRDGTPRGLTCTSMCSVSLHPPILLACLHNHSETLAAMLARGSFAVNLLHAGGKGAAEVFAGPVADRFVEVEWETTPWGGLPWLSADAHAVAECAVAGSVEAGDHVVVFGEVADVMAEPEQPLLYGLRQYAAWTAADGRVIPLRR
ncbi:MAG TPA: flavin reductase family protein [Amycolatopsis sp.]|nr:flavin reductase family protein [Amycolatopsis sp.]